LGGGISGGNVLISDEGDELVDTAGRTGTIEARCRADRIVDYARMHGADVDDVRSVYALARAGDAAALGAVELYRSWLAKAIAALAVAHGVDGVVVGGGPATPDAPWLTGLEELVLPRLWPSHRLFVAVSALGDAAAPVGLAHLVRSSA
jgi:predicted NBD/HSP70 family sugar kinase